MTLTNLTPRLIMIWNRRSTDQGLDQWIGGAISLSEPKTDQEAGCRFVTSTPQSSCSALASWSLTSKSDQEAKTCSTGERSLTASFPTVWQTGKVTHSA